MADNPYLRARYGMLIDGKEEFTDTMRTVYEPATGEALAEVAYAGRAEVDRAVAAAGRALSGPWQRLAPARRARMIYKVAELMQGRLAELAEVEARSAGKAVSSALGEITQAVEDFEFYAGAVTKLHGETIPQPGGVFAYTVREPVGVCAQIVPWNYPLMMAAWKLAPALAAGCTVVLKPASVTPITAILLGEICREAGIPDGVVNILPAPGGEVGDYLVGHPGVQKVTFTGETETGKRVMATASGGLKRVTLELGGKSPNVVFADADIEAAVLGSIYAIYYNAGQSCEARSRLILHESVHDRFLELFIEKARSLRVGDPLDPKTQVGALISRQHEQKVHGYVEKGVAEGAALLLGGGRPEGVPEAGAFYLPTVLGGVRPEATVAQEEIFGPVVTVTTFQTEAQALAIANGVEYGLAGTLWTRDVARAHRVAGGIQAGLIGVNTPLTGWPGLPFGGFKQSGFGRELSLETLHLYTEQKTVLVHTREKPINPMGV